jgi:DNA-binding FrmR family transcriptional regulator
MKFVIKHASGFYYIENIAERIADCFQVLSPFAATTFDVREAAQAVIDEKMQEFMPSLLSIEVQDE